VAYGETPPLPRMLGRIRGNKMIPSKRRLASIDGLLKLSLVDYLATDSLYFSDEQIKSVGVLFRSNV
jgi:hypothetical protein